MEHFKEKYKTGIVARIPERSKNDIRKEIGLKEKEYAVLFAMGGSNQEIICRHEKNIKILTMNSIVNSAESVLNYSEWLEGQELVSASDLVICKCGYGMISECLTNGIPFYYVSDDNHLEQKAMTEELSGYSLAKRTTLVEISNLHFNQKFIDNLPLEDKMPRDNENVTVHIMEFLKN